MPKPLELPQSSSWECMPKYSSALQIKFIDAALLVQRFIKAEAKFSSQEKSQDAKA